MPAKQRLSAAHQLDVAPDIPAAAPPPGLPLGHRGFTLIELVLATLIASLVIAILSVALSFSLRMWEKNQNSKVKESFRLLELVKWQIASFDPVAVNIEDEPQKLFQGSRHTLVFATGHSIKALSKGAPVIARYVYAPGERRLYYSEMPLDPYHPKTIQEFMDPERKRQQAWPPAYPIELKSFEVKYFGQDSKTAEDSWPGGGDVPAAVLVELSAPEDPTPRYSLMVPGFLFPVTDTTPKAGLGGEEKP